MFNKNKPYPLYETDNINDLRELLLLKVKNQPEDVAFAFWKKKNGAYRELIEKTYAEFYNEALSLAGTLSAKGFKGVNIGILGDNSYEWLVSYMAIILSLNTAVLFDKDMSAEEIKELIRKTDTEALFISDKYKERLAASGTDKINVFLLEEIKYDSTAYVPEEPDTDKPCCIFFTSGTTGGRKAVMLSQKNIVFDIKGSCRLFKLEGNTYAVLPFHHAFGLIVGVLMVFHYGHTVYIGSGLRYIKKEMAEAKPQTMMLVPLFVESFCKQISDTARREGRDKKLRLVRTLSDMLLRLGIDLRRYLFKEVLAFFGGRLEYAICGGAALDISFVKDLRSFGIEVLCGYGITECSPCVSVNRNDRHKDGTVGLPIPGSYIRIENDGEVLIHGEHVMMGYYGDDAGTKEALTPDGWYHTGDIGNLDEDGFLTVTGRKKNLIILSNGENVSPEELESTLMRIEGIKEVLVSEDKGQIKAEIVLSPTDRGKKAAYALIEKEVEELNRTLPPYKRITKTVFREKEFEKTTTMKIKRQ